jgi:hypothetical protein
MIRVLQHCGIVIRGARAGRYGPFPTCKQKFHI